MSEDAKAADKPATYKQKKYIRSLIEKSGKRYEDSDIEILTVKEASRLIDSLKGEG